jgi:hypothetical protein
MHELRWPVRHLESAHPLRKARYMSALFVIETLEAVLRSYKSIASSRPDSSIIIFEALLRRYSNELKQGSI